MRPYYEQDGITIYHGDCREMLPVLALESTALLIADPPYGISYKPLRGSNGSKMWGADTVRGDGESFDPRHLLGFSAAVLWGANHYASRLPDRAGWIVWDKTPNGTRQGFIYSHCELAWTNLRLGHVEKYALEWQGADRDGEQFLHPTQKPQGLMRWLIQRFATVGQAILDPYIGSGTTLRAAKDLGRKAIGIEIEERYCEIAARRLDQGVLDLAPASREPQK